VVAASPQNACRPVFAARVCWEGLTPKAAWTRASPSCPPPPHRSPVFKHSHRRFLRNTGNGLFFEVKDLKSLRINSEIYTSWGRIISNQNLEFNSAIFFSQNCLGKGSHFGNENKPGLKLKTLFLF